MSKIYDWALICGNMPPEDVLNEEEYEIWLQEREDFFDMYYEGDL